MHKVFVSGSMKIKNLRPAVLSRLDNIIASKYQVIVGDADGVDSSIQSYLYERAVQDVVVYCAGRRPRNNIGKWKVESITTEAKPGTRAYFTAKDLKMAEDCDYGLMIWDTKSTGTLSNALELLKRNKLALVYVNKEKKFVKLKNVQDIFVLLTFMSERAKEQADSKIRLTSQVESLRHKQESMF